MKRVPATAEEKAYSRGYAAGKKRRRRHDQAIIDALERHVDYWRAQARARATSVLAHGDEVEPSDARSS